MRALQQRDAAIAVPLRDGDAYYMLRGFNEAHHHAVLAGSSGYATAVDLWSLGCIFGEMLGGKPVFNGSSTLDTVRRRVTVEPTAVRAGSGQWRRRVSHSSERRLRRPRVQSPQAYSG